MDAIQKHFGGLVYLRFFLLDGGGVLLGSASPWADILPGAEVAAVVMGWRRGKERVAAAVGGMDGNCGRLWRRKGKDLQ